MVCLSIKFFRFPPCFSLLSLSNDCMICNSNKLKKKFRLYIVYSQQNKYYLLFPCKQNTVNMNINYKRLCHYFFLLLLNIESKIEGQNFFVLLLKLYIIPFKNSFFLFVIFSQFRKMFIIMLNLKVFLNSCKYI